MKVFTIYAATCLPNGKCYVGFDSRWPARRHGHEQQARLGCGYKFHRAIRKHGRESFEWEVLYQSLDREHCLRVMEPHFVAERDSFRSGYNSTLGGEGAIGRVPTAEHRSNLSKALKGRAISAEWRAKLSASRRARPPASPKTRAKMSVAMKGRKRSPEVRARMSAAQKAKAPPSPEARARMSASRRAQPPTPARTRAKIAASAKLAWRRRRAQT